MKHTVDIRKDIESAIGDFELVTWLIIKQGVHKDMKNNTNLIMYTTEDGITRIQATFDNDTVWLSID